LEDGLYELRAKEGRVQYRILYAFVNQAAVLVHGFSKEGAIPLMEMQRAQERRRAYAANPAVHTYEGDFQERKR
jgi:phage-related protein